MSEVKFTSGVDQSGFERDLGSMHGKMMKFNASMVAAISRFAAPAALAAGVGAIGKAALESADRIQDLADRYKATAVDVQRIGSVAKVMGTGVESSLSSVKKLRLALVEAADGGKAQNEALRAMGVSVAELENLALPDLLARVAEGYQRAEQSGRGLHAITKLMGESADELIPMLSQGSAALKEMFDATAVASDERVQKLADLADGWERLKSGAMAYAVDGLGAVMDGWTKLLEMVGRHNPEDFAATSMGGGQDVPQWGPDTTPEEQARLMGAAAPAGFKAGEESPADAAERERMTRERAGAEWLAQEEARQKAAADAERDKDEADERAAQERRREFEDTQRQIDLEMQIAALRGTGEQRAMQEARLRVEHARRELELAAGTGREREKALALARAEADLANRGGGGGATKDDRIKAFIDQGMSISEARSAVREEDKRQRNRGRIKDRYDRIKGDRPSLIDDPNQPTDQAGYIRRGSLINEYGFGQGTRPGDVTRRAGSWVAGGGAVAGPGEATAGAAEAGAGGGGLQEIAATLGRIEAMMQQEVG